jgi:hypothetical protein
MRTRYYVFGAEIRRAVTLDKAMRRDASLLFAAFLDGLSHGLSRENAAESSRAVDSLIQDLIVLKDMPHPGYPLPLRFL